MLFCFCLVSLYIIELSAKSIACLSNSFALFWFVLWFVYSLINTVFRYCFELIGQTVSAVAQTSKRLMKCILIWCHITATFDDLCRCCRQQTLPDPRDERSRLRNNYKNVLRFVVLCRASWQWSVVSNHITAYLTRHKPQQNHQKLHSLNSSPNFHTICRLFLWTTVPRFSCESSHVIYS